jgi:hypothetical protein
MFGLGSEPDTLMIGMCIFESKDVFDCLPEDSDDLGKAKKGLRSFMAELDGPMEEAVVSFDRVLSWRGSFASWINTLTYTYSICILIHACY